MKKKEKGYVLAVVMLFSLLLAMVLVTTFAICYRYQRAAQRNMEELRQEVFKPAESATPENGGDTADPTQTDSGNPESGGTGTNEGGTTENPGEPVANASDTANFADINASDNATSTSFVLPQNCGERQG